MSLPNVLAVLVLVVGVPLNALVAFMLWRRSRANPKIRVLRERLIAELAVLLLVIVFSLVFLNNDRLPPWLTTDVTKVVTRVVVLGVAVIPALYWLSLYRKKEPRAMTARAEHALERSADAAEQTAANTAEIAENTRPDPDGPPPR